MALHKYRLSFEAESDFDEVFDHTLNEFGHVQAISYTGDLKVSVETVAFFPLIGRRYTTKKGKEFRRYNSGRHAIFYLSEQDDDEDCVFIVRILHCASDFDAYLD